ncbi:MAG: hypothetical protein K8J31_31640, partial [Anaerolineae bacterium]|nr:hypothetical protein [Anaerolineae bacterium]
MPSPRERVKTALRHELPDRVPVDFLATPEIWKKLADYWAPDLPAVSQSDYFDPTWEAVLRRLEVDCRVISYDQFCDPPETILASGATVTWWDAFSRSTPNRMWRQVTPSGDVYDIWGHHIRVVENTTGAYEEYVDTPLGNIQSLNDLKGYAWPQPDWWDFSPLPHVLTQLDAHEPYHVRFRIGSVFETAWQLRGMQAFLMDMAIDPEIPLYILDRLTEVFVENTRRVLELAGDRLDMVYFYDDVATQKGLLMSRDMWERFIKSRHRQLIEVAEAFHIPVMYHCDGAIARLIPDLLDMGITVLNPIQVSASGMEPHALKAAFGDRLTFHGGIDIIETLPKGTPEGVRDEVCSRVKILGQNGGYIMSSAHHIQADTPLENVLAMYDVSLRICEQNQSASVEEHIV